MKVSILNCGKEYEQGNDVGRSHGTKEREMWE